MLEPVSHLVESGATTAGQFYSPLSCLCLHAGGGPSSPWTLHQRVLGLSKSAPWIGSGGGGEAWERKAEMQLKAAALGASPLASLAELQGNVAALAPWPFFPLSLLRTVPANCPAWTPVWWPGSPHRSGSWFSSAEKSKGTRCQRMGLAPWPFGMPACRNAHLWTKNPSGNWVACSALHGNQKTHLIESSVALFSVGLFLYSLFVTCSSH